MAINEFPEISIRNALVTDIPVILEIVNNAILNSTALYDYNPRTLSYQENWLLDKQKNNKPVLVVTSNGLTIGFGTYDSFRSRDAYRFTIEHSIYIAEGYQSKGIGKVLMESLISLAKKEGYHTMVAGIDSNNKSSIAFHKKFGFIELCCMKEVGYKFDRWLDLTFMQLML